MRISDWSSDVCSSDLIPVALIERVEVLKDGASAIYGADAVAGVVNIITRKEFDGAEVSVSYGETFQQDGEEGSVDLTWGMTGDRGSIMAAINYSASGTVNMADRAPCRSEERRVGKECVST